MQKRFFLIVSAIVLVSLLIYRVFIHVKKHEQPASVRVESVDSTILKKILQNKDYLKAEFYGEKQHPDSAIDLFKKLLTTFSGENEEESRQFLTDRLIWTYVQKGNYDTAHTYFNQLFASVHQRFDTANLVDAMNFRTAGFLFHYLNKPDSAVACYRQSLRIYERILGPGSNDVANCYGKMGDVYLFLKMDYYQAQHYYMKANQIFESLGPKKIKPLYLRVLYNLSSANRLKGDYDKALQYALKTYEVADELADSSSLVYISGLIANIYASSSDFKNAIKYIRQAIDGNKGQSVYLQIQLGDNYNKLSQYYGQIGNYKQSLACARKGLEILQRVGNPIKEMYEANSYEHLGLACMSMGDLQEALGYLMKSLRLRIDYYGPVNSKVAYTYDLIGNYYDREIGSPDSALSCYQKSIISSTGNENLTSRFQNPSFAEAANKEQLPYTLAYKAAVLKKIYVKNHSDTSSLLASCSGYALADSLITYYRKSIDSEQSRMALSVNYHEFYEQAIESAYLCYRQTGKPEYIDEAFRFFEKNKYLLLLEKIAGSNLMMKAGVPDSIQYAERMINEQLRKAQQEFVMEQQKSVRDTLKISILNKKIYSLFRKNDELKIFLEKNYPAYFNLKYEDFSDNLGDLKRYSADHHTMILQYFWGENSLYTIGVKGTASVFTRTEVTDGLKNQLRGFIAMLHAAEVMDRQKFEDYKKLGFALYKALVSNVADLDEPAWKPGGSITVIPDGLLTKLAFDALVDTISPGGAINYKSLSYLVYKYNVQYEYSSNLLLTDVKDRPARVVKNVLGMGYSTGGEGNITGKKSGFLSLPGSFREMKVIAPARNAKILTGIQASESNFKRYAPFYDILHLAIHGIADEKEGNGTRLIFRAENDSLNDGQLFPDEIYNMNLKAQLTVLSACETGLGKVVPGEGVFSMARAFSYAGCPTVVISLWKVNDHATAELMKNFYHWLYDGVPVGKSLSRAKQDYLRLADGYTSHPSYWASFAAFGDMTPLRQPGRFFIPLLTMFLALLISGMVYWFIHRRLKNKAVLNKQAPEKTMPPQ